MVMNIESEKINDVVDYSMEHLKQIKSMINDNFKAVEEISCILIFVYENKEIFTNNLTSIDPTASYISFHHCKHRDFINSITFLADLCNNSEKSKKIRDSNSPAKMKKTLDIENATFAANIENLKELDRGVNMLKSLHNETLSTITKPFNSSSL